MSEKKLGALYLLPVPIYENTIQTLPTYTVDAILSLRFFIAERAKTARQHLKLFNPDINYKEIEVVEMAEKSPTVDYGWLHKTLHTGENVGVMSEAGTPCVADPGNSIVTWAHKNGFKVVPFVGPNAIILALMASGLNGQNFSFVGYISAKSGETERAIKKLEEISHRLRQSQIFIETPYRNVALFQNLLRTLSPTTQLCVAAKITSPDEFIETHIVSVWKTKPEPSIHKEPTIFLIQG